MKFNESNKKRLVINIDLDGVLTSSGAFWNDNVEPNNKNIERVKKLYTQGNIIIIWTARNWSTASLTVAWLIKHEIPFHGIQMSKGGADCYIDDKSTTFESLLGDTVNPINPDTTIPKPCPNCGDFLRYEKYSQTYKR